MKKEECKACEKWDNIFDECSGGECPPRAAEVKANAAGKSRDNIQAFMQLVKDNPDLVILPMVDNQVVCGDEYCYWGGSWGTPEVEEYMVDDERIVFKNDEDPTEYAESQLIQEEFDKMGEKEIEQWYEDLPWIKAIVVKIELP